MWRERAAEMRLMKAVITGDQVASMTVGIVFHWDGVALSRSTFSIGTSRDPECASAPRGRSHGGSCRAPPSRRTAAAQITAAQGSAWQRRRQCSAALVQTVAGSPLAGPARPPPAVGCCVPRRTALRPGRGLGAVWQGSQRALHWQGSPSCCPERRCARRILVVDLSHRLMIIAAMQPSVALHFGPVSVRTRGAMRRPTAVCSAAARCADS